MNQSPLFQAVFTPANILQLKSAAESETGAVLTDVRTTVIRVAVPIVLRLDGSGAALADVNAAILSELIHAIGARQAQTMAWSQQSAPAPHPTAARVVSRRR